MLNPRKIRLMSRMAIFENSKEGKEAFRITGFFRSDYLRWELLRTIASITIGYILLVGMAVVYNLEYLLLHAVELNYRALLIRALGIYLVILIVYVAGAFVAYTYSYARRRKLISRYEKSLRSLEKIYKAEDQEKKGGQA